MPGDDADDADDDDDGLWRSKTYAHGPYSIRHHQI